VALGKPYWHSFILNPGVAFGVEGFYKVGIGEKKEKGVFS
jgi:hypothetical protein